MGLLCLYVYSNAKKMGLRFDVRKLVALLHEYWQHPVYVTDMKRFMYVGKFE
jgi:hypothetical protein